MNRIRILEIGRSRSPSPALPLSQRGREKTRIRGSLAGFSPFWKGGTQGGWLFTFYRSPSDFSALDFLFYPQY
jgi:hypothetical protein